MLMSKVAIMYARFGPYHIARLSACRDFLGELDREVVGIEICPDDRYYAWRKEDEQDGLRRIPVLPGRHYRGCTRREIQDSVYRVLTAELPDVVALPGWYFAEATAGLQWCRDNRRIPILMSESCRHDAKRVWWREWPKRVRVGQFPSALVGGSLHAQYLTQLGMKETQIFCGHNVVDNTHFRVRSDEARASESDLRQALRLPDRYILALGRLVPLKNFAKLLQAYRLYCDRVGRIAYHLVLCGDGEECTGLERQILDLSLQGKVILPGFVQYEELPIYYGLASAFVHPSTVEPWGLVVNEAMAAGLPVLVSNRCGCAPDLVKEGINGYTFDPDDVEKIADRMMALHLHRDSLLGMGQASREIISKWSPNRFAQGLWQSICAAEGI